jgi:hypothetical protein
MGIWFLVLAIVVLTLWNQKLEHDVHRLQAEMIRYVLPRQLTKEQIDTFRNYLSSHSQPHEVRIKYISGDRESQGYAGDFASAFRAGNWLPNFMPLSPVAITCNENVPGSKPPFTCSSELQQVVNSLEEISIMRTGPNPPPPSTLEEKLHPTPSLDAVISEALRAAGLQGISSGYSNNADPPNTVTVFIGHRPRDRYAVIPQNFYEKTRRNPREITDDDFEVDDKLR